MPPPGMAAPLQMPMPTFPGHAHAQRGPNHGPHAAAPTGNVFNDARRLQHSLGASWYAPDIDGKIQWRISQKYTESLMIFNNKSAEYRLWKEKMTDHISHNWMTWRHLLELAEKSTNPIPNNDARAMIKFGGNGSGKTSTTRGGTS